MSHLAFTLWSIYCIAAGAIIGAATMTLWEPDHEVCVGFGDRRD